MSFNNAWSVVETQILIDAIKQFKEIYPNAVYVKRDFLCEALRVKGFVRKVTEISSKLQSMKYVKKVKKLEQADMWTSEEESTFLAIKATSPTVTWREVNLLMTIRHPKFHKEEEILVSKWEELSRRTNFKYGDNERMDENVDEDGETEQEMFEGLIFEDGMVDNENENQREEVVEKEEEEVEDENENEEGTEETAMGFDVDEEEEEEIEDENDENGNNARKAKLRKPLSKREVKHLDEMIAECRKLREGENPFFNSEYFETFQKVSVMANVKYRKSQFVELTEKDVRDEWERRFILKYSVDKKKARENAVNRLCCIPYEVNGKKRNEFFFTERDYLFDVVLNGLYMLRYSTGCASWMSDFVDLKCKPFFSEVKVVALARGHLAAFRLKMEAVQACNNIGNYRKAYVNRMDEESFNYLRNNLRQCGCDVT